MAECRKRKLSCPENLDLTDDPIEDPDSISPPKSKIVRIEASEKSKIMEEDTLVNLLDTIKKLHQNCEDMANNLIALIEKETFEKVELKEILNDDLKAKCDKALLNVSDIHHFSTKIEKRIRAIKAIAKK